MKFKHLTYNDRLKIEALVKLKCSPRVISNTLNFSYSTICRELNRGKCKLLTSELIPYDSYSADIANNDYILKSSLKGINLKISNDYDLANFIENKIVVEKFSPEAVLAYIKNNNLNFKTNICKSTLYSYIDKGLFLKLSNKNLPYCKRKKSYKHIRNISKKRPLLKSIEQRNLLINSRNSFGHWEMDTVIGLKTGRQNCLLVLSERYSRQEIIIKIKEKTSSCVVSALDKLNKIYKNNFSNIFRTITCDNGPEFSDYLGIEKNNRTILYYCHPYCSWERGTNENINRMIRRFIPKGKSINTYSNTDILYIENWINNYPRKIHNWKSSNQVFNEELKKLNII